jgi:SAM-dependent MidA family methyltransferase
LSSGVPLLIEFIRANIRDNGPVSFPWFMEQALYHPAHGYYSSGRAALGRHGDYFTSVSVGPLFGCLLAAQFAEIWAALERPNDFTIVEQGAHGGEFARDVLEAVRQRHPEFFETLRYQIVEPFPILEQRQKDALADFRPRVLWRKSLAQLEPFCGIHFSNELLDAMPVHLVRWTGSAWVERHVTEVDGSFAFIGLPISNPQLEARLRAVPLPLPKNYETEVSLAVPDWIEALSQKLRSGIVLTVDYGFPRAEFYGQHRSSGTLRCYAKHQVNSSPLEQVGQVDITAHVEWTSVVERAELCGLQVAGFTDQHHFITGLLAGEIRPQFEASTDAKTKRALQTLLHPNFLGMTFQFLLLGKNMVPDAELFGLRFARDGRAALFRT